jgi:hypothetical protein
MELAALPEPAARGFASFLEAARRRFVVTVDAAALAAPHACETLLALCATGAPVRVTGNPIDLPRLVGTALAEALVEPAALDQRERELRSIALRRSALALGMRSAPPVSVLLPSRRPHDIRTAIGQIAAQRQCRLQLVIGLHGDQWPAAIEESLVTAAHAGAAIADVVVSRHPAELSLGAMLSAMTELSDGPLVTKWDDDDWYGPEHVLDLVLAHDYSGAEVVGKAAEFVYLESSDTTIRRMSIGAESYSATIAGGTLLMSRSWLDELGGWPDVPTAVDRHLLGASQRAGGSTYRTHGFQYVLRRRADGGHTWASSDDYFLAAATQRRAGLDLGFAGIDDLAES